MVFTKRLRDGVRRGRIRCSVRVWMQPRVKVGGRYPMDEGHIVVDSIEPIEMEDITHDLARESGFAGVDDLLQIAKSSFVKRRDLCAPAGHPLEARGSILGHGRHEGALLPGKPYRSRRTARVG